jgi:hypothetical protein
MIVPIRVRWFRQSVQDVGRPRQKDHDQGAKFLLLQERKGKDGD